MFDDFLSKALKSGVVLALGGDDDAPGVNAGCRQHVEASFYQSEESSSILCVKFCERNRKPTPSLIWATADTPIVCARSRPLCCD